MEKRKKNPRVTLADSELLTFDIFVKKARARALAYANRRVRNTDLAEDILFEALMRLHRAWPESIRKNYATGFALLKKGISWAISDHSRKRSDVSLDSLLEAGYEPPTLSITETSEDSIILTSILSNVSEEDKLILSLDVDGLTAEEIARYVGKSVPATKSRLYRVRAWIQEQFLSTRQAPEKSTPPKKEAGWYTVVSVATILQKTTPWVLIHLRAIGSPFKVCKTLGVYRWPHVPEATVRRLRKLAEWEKSHKKITVINGPRHNHDGWLTSRQLSHKLGHSEEWVLRRLVKYLVQAEYRKASNGKVCLYYPPAVYKALESESSSLVEGRSWYTVGKMAEKLGRHPLWVNLRLPKLSAQLKIRPEVRKDKTGAKAEHWPPAMLESLQREANQFPDKGDWVSILSIAAQIGKDREWVEERLRLLGITPRSMRIPGSGKVSPHYPPTAIVDLREMVDAIPPRAPRGWYTKQGLEAKLGKSANWTNTHIKRLRNPQADIYRDTHNVPRIFYGPTVLKTLKKVRDRDSKRPPQDDYLSIAQIASKTGKSQGWTKKQIKLLKIRGSFRRDGQGRIRRFYKPSTVKMIRDRIP